MQPLLAPEERKVVEGLARLGCPMLQEIPSLDNVLVPGSLRLRLLEWLFHRYDPELLKRTSLDGLNPTFNSEATTLLKMSNAATLLGLCAANDMQIIQGSQVSGDKERQLRFLGTFVDLVTLAAGMEDEIQLDEQFHKDCTLANYVAHQRIALFSSSSFTFSSASASASTSTKRTKGSSSNKTKKETKSESKRRSAELERLKEWQQQMTAELEQLQQDLRLMTATNKTRQLQQDENTITEKEEGEKEREALLLRPSDLDFASLSQKLLSFQRICQDFDRTYDLQIASWLTPSPQQQEAEEEGRRKNMLLGETVVQVSEAFAQFGQQWRALKSLCHSHHRLQQQKEGMEEKRRKERENENVDGRAELFGEEAVMRVQEEVAVLEATLLRWQQLQHTNSHSG
ncbi:HAUS augmin-like complex subunit 7 [Balamuthia mandrillaris]